MPPVKQLLDNVSISGWLSPADFSKVKVLGFDGVINFRPDDESRDQTMSLEAQASAEAAGLRYIHIPVSKHDLFIDAVVTRAAHAFTSHGRVLAYCASGLRAAIIWAAASARTQSVAGVLSSLNGAGFDVRFVREDLEAQFERARWSNDADKSGDPAADRVPSRATAVAA